MALPKQIVRGLFQWTAVHPEIRTRVSSYYLARERVLIDPWLPSPGGLEWLERHGPPEHILLTNRLHSRHSARLVAAFGCTVWCHRSGLYDLDPRLKKVKQPLPRYTSGVMGKYARHVSSASEGE